MWNNRRARHLSDQQILDCYLSAEAVGLPGEQPSHLATCSTCGQRYADLTRDLDAMAEDGADEADGVFTPGRLAEQHDRIMLRIAHLGRRADIVLFPSRGTRAVAPATRAWRPTGWAAAAAVAGLAAGVALGLTLDQFGFGRTAVEPGSTLARTVPGTDSPGLAVGGVDEDELLDSIDSALTTRRVPELLVFDEMTPERVAFSPRLR
jgi:hypothetical protein